MFKAKKTINYPTYTVALVVFILLWAANYVGNTTMTIIALAYVCIVNFMEAEVDEDKQDTIEEFKSILDDVEAKLRAVINESKDNSDVAIEIRKVAEVGIYCCEEEKVLVNNPEYWKLEKKFFDMATMEQKPIVLDENSETSEKSE